ncbi:MAG: MobA-like transferase domain protein [Actinomycetia bacterium]|nr:MobA-like transferase domain protein [Actinomycetes bacterium]
MNAAVPGPARQSDLTVLILAGGLGTRFGRGAKPLAAVGPHGESPLDATLASAAAAGYARAVVVLRSDLEPAVRGHVERMASTTGGRSFPIEWVRQDEDAESVAATAAGRTRPLGTAHAVLSAADELTGPFAIANADDVYGDEPLRLLGRQLTGAGGHALVGFRVARTLLSARPVSRALCVAAPDGRLLAVHEGTVTTAPDQTLTWTGDDPGRRQPLTGDELVSMNLWGFQPSVLPRLRDALDDFRSAGLVPTDAELALPSVVDHMLQDPHAESIVLLPTESRCLGVTYAEDVALLRAALAAEA